MKRSPLRHPLAVLRTTIGLSQKEMGQLVGRSAATIQAIELGHLDLSQELAMLIVQTTGIDLAWLMAGDPAKPPCRGPTVFGVHRSPGPYTRADYESHRALLESPCLTPDQLANLREAGKALPKAEIKAFFQTQMAKVHRHQDKALIKRIKHLLDNSAALPEAELIRWKLRQCCENLATDCRLSATKLCVPPRQAGT